MHNPLLSTIVGRGARPLFFALATAVVVGAASASPIFTPGNLVVSLVGNVDGSGPYTDNQATPVKLQEMTTSGVLGNALLLPQTTTVVNGVTQYAVSGEYGSSSEGLLHRSADGLSLVIAGYGVNAKTYNTGGASTYGDARLAQSTSIQDGQYTAVPRVITDITIGGQIDSSTGLYNVFNTNNPRSVATLNGSSFYIAGQGASNSDPGLYFAVKGASAATLISGASDYRSVSIQNGQVFASRDFNGPSGAQATEIDRFATAQPTSASTATALPGIGPSITLSKTAYENGVNNSRFNTTVYLSPEDDYFASDGINQFLYVADSGNPKNGSAGKAALGEGGLQKWELVNGTWMLLYDISSGLNLVADNAAAGKGTTGLIGLTGQVIGGITYLYATNATIGDLDQTYVFSVLDPLEQTTLGQAAASDLFSTIYTAPAGTNVRGIAFAPVPEPATWSLAAIGFVGMVAMRRRRVVAMSRCV